MGNILITNIKGLVQVRDKNPAKIAGAQMAELPVLKNAFLLIKDGLIADYGHMNNCPTDANLEKIDGNGRFVFPSYVDSHTHLVFAGSREAEFVLRIKGATYEEIAQAGGGILNSAKKLAQTSEEDLYKSAFKRLQEIIQSGTGAVEIKSGYGLSTQDEIKMLRVIKELKKNSPIPIKATFLGAHAIPLQYKENRGEYIRLITEGMIPQIAQEELAEYVDVFCDRGFFTVEETETIMLKGLEFGLKPRLHANELDYSGGIQIGTKYNAVSVDHLEFTGEAEIEALLNSTTIPTLLPSTAFFLRLHNPPARQMIDAGLAVALASDYNPGSSPSGNMNFVLSLACINLRMTPEEAINAATINSSHALEVADSLGSITRGKKGNVFITEPMQNYSFIPYSFGTNRIERVIINGKIVE